MTKRTTAADLVSELSRSPDFRQSRDQRESERRINELRLRHAESSVVAELRCAGFDVQSIWDLAPRDGYAEAVPILIHHLPDGELPSEVREAIARVLATPEARPYWKQLSSLYLHEDDGRVKDGLAVALAASADLRNPQGLVDLLRDPSLGSSRVLLLGALDRMNEDIRAALLIELVHDPQLTEEVRRLQGRYGAGAGSSE